MTGPHDQPADPAAGSVTARPWGATAEGVELHLYDLAVPGGIAATISDLGGIVTHLHVPGADGLVGDVVLGHDEPGPYLGRAESPYFGALIGRYGNRIRAGRFNLDGHEYTLATNNGPNALHGGPGGFDQQVWTARPAVGEDGPALELRLVSPDGDEGYPGTLDVTVTYTVTRPTGGDLGGLRIEYVATTDAPTVVNLTNHSYFNLVGDASRDVLGHELTLHADQFTPVDDTLIPTGELRDVTGTPFDFRAGRAVGDLIDDADVQLAYGGGYDHNLVLRGEGLRVVGEVHEPRSGRVMEVRTTEPGVQFYSGNFLDGSIRGKRGRAYGPRWALCLETQHFPDSPNHPNFPSTVLRPGETYRSRTEYVFSVRTTKGS
ncbi:aldose epimerase family protein [Deinococcus pimensis]|uniref:aldose epimerase family protein n=1 Tax=Deinococcus pimensis TaxID=309888 RepID=UPI0004857FA4|nr:aldose epimerase family protein [Deinococcus pimensis]